MFLLIFETERDRAWAGEGQRDRGRHRMWNRLQALSCQHRAQCRVWTPELWDHDLSRSQMLNWLSHPGAWARFLKKYFTRTWRFIFEGKCNGKWIQETFIKDSEVGKRNQWGSVVEIGLKLSGEEMGGRRELMFVEHLLCAKCFACVISL